MSKNKQKTKWKIGITGGIGSGKTTACKIFETLGIPIYYADERAKWLMVNDLSLIQKIKNLLGSEAYEENGSLNRTYIAGIVFQDKSKLEQLNGIVHPAVFLDGVHWHDGQIDVPYTLKEAALLFEGKGHQFLDKIITVTAPEEVRIARVMERDNVPKEAVVARMEKQLPDEEKVKLADFVIYNDGKKSLVEQVMEIHHKILKI